MAGNHLTRCGLQGDPDPLRVRLLLHAAPHCIHWGCFCSTAARHVCQQTANMLRVQNILRRNTGVRFNAQRMRALHPPDLMRLLPEPAQNPRGNDVICPRDPIGRGRAPTVFWGPERARDRRLALEPAVTAVILMDGWYGTTRPTPQARKQGCVCSHLSGGGVCRAARSGKKVGQRCAGGTLCLLTSACSWVCRTTVNRRG